MDLRWLVAVGTLVVGGCGDDGSASSDDGDSGDSDTVSDDDDDDDDDDMVDTTVGDDDDDMVDTTAGDDDDDDVPGSTGGSGTGDDDDDDDTGDASTSDTGGSEGGSTGGVEACAPAPAALPYLWVANSAEHTISKVNTEEMIELARYRTSPADDPGSPSRTSVNFNGDMAVANRFGGVVAFAGDPENCPNPANTSSGGGDVLDFGDDGCLLWEAPFDYGSQRPVAWTQGTWSEDTCRYENTRVWTSGSSGVIEVLLLDGETGETLDQVAVPEVPPGSFGLYGGAVDGNGDFWGTMLSSGSVVHVSFDDLSYETIDQPHGGYGMAIDAEGRLWTCSTQAARYDPELGEWDPFAVGGSTGCNVDGNGVLWMATSGSVIAVDTDTGALLDTIALPNTPRGVSVMYDGRIFAVQSLGSDGHRIDPATGDVDTIDAFVGAYTYSDMTGFALVNVTPGGGM